MPEGKPKRPSANFTREELERRAIFVRAVVQTLVDGIITINERGLIESVNPAVERLFGYTEDELLGKNIKMLMPSPYREQHDAFLARYVATGTGRVIGNVLELPGRRKDGSIFPMSLSVSEVRFSGVRYFTGVVHDVSEQKKTQAALHSSEEMLRTLADNLPDGVVFQAHDAPDGRRTITHVSAGVERVFDFTQDEIRDNPALYYERMLPEDQPRALEVETESKKNQSQFDLEFRIRMRDGTVKWLHCRAMPRRLPDGSTIWEGVFLDISARKRIQEETRLAKEEADKANRAKSEFLSRMSHELRTPLNAILGFAQLLELSNPNPRQRGQVDQILKGGRHLLTLINEVLDLASIEAGRIEMSVEPISVSNLFQEVLDLIRPLASKRGISLRIEPAVDASTQVQADNQRLKQVLLNLVSNAVKYNVERGSVELTCRGSGSGLRLSVTDTGPGIDADKLGRLFTPFDRLGAESTTVEGSGLGLVLSKRLTEAMGGTLGVESAPGRTTFWVDLPRAASLPETLDPANIPTLAADESQRSATVLYVEDNLDNLRLVEGILAYRPKIKLLSGLQGRVALDLARQHLPDLILLDVHLPDIKGDEVLRRLKADPALQAIPVIVISADATANQIARLRAAGADDYLTKPIDVVRFLEIVDGRLKARA